MCPPCPLVPCNDVKGTGRAEERLLYTSCDLDKRICTSAPSSFEYLGPDELRKVALKTRLEYVYGANGTYYPGVGVYYNSQPNASFDGTVKVLRCDSSDKMRCLFKMIAMNAGKEGERDWTEPFVAASRKGLAVAEKMGHHLSSLFPVPNNLSTLCVGKTRKCYTYSNNDNNNNNTNIVPLIESTISPQFPRGTVINGIKGGVNWRNGAARKVVLDGPQIVPLRKPHDDDNDWEESDLGVYIWPFPLHILTPSWDVDPVADTICFEFNATCYTTTNRGADVLVSRFFVLAGFNPAVEEDMQNAVYYPGLPDTAFVPDLEEVGIGDLYYPSQLLNRTLFCMTHHLFSCFLRKNDTNVFAKSYRMCNLI